MKNGNELFRLIDGGAGTAEERERLFTRLAQVQNPQGDTDTKFGNYTFVGNVTVLGILNAAGLILPEMVVHDHTSLAGGGKLDHGSAMDGLGDDDHTQYFNATRHTLAVHTSLGLVPSTRTISAGMGLTGGGDLSGNITLALNAAYAMIWTNTHTFPDIKVNYQAEAGNVRAGNGTAAAPAYSFTNDSNSGFYSGGNGILCVSVNAATPMTFNSNLVIVDAIQGIRSARGIAIGPVNGNTAVSGLDPYSDKSCIMLNSEASLGSYYGDHSAALLYAHLTSNGWGWAEFRMAGATGAGAYDTAAPFLVAGRRSKLDGNHGVSLIIDNGAAPIRSDRWVQTRVPYNCWLNYITYHGSGVIRGTVYLQYSTDDVNWTSIDSRWVDTRVNALATGIQLSKDMYLRFYITPYGDNASTHVTCSVFLQKTV